MEKYCTAGQATVRQYGACALHAGYLRIHTQTDRQTHTHTHSENAILTAFSLQRYYTNAPHCYVYVHCLSFSIQQFRYVAIIRSLDTLLLYTDPVLLFGNVPIRHIFNLIHLGWIPCGKQT